MVNKLWPVRAKHYYIGLNIGLDVGTLETFQGKTDDEAFREVIKTRLNKEPKLTWKDIVGALRQPSVAEEALANEIAKEYCPSEIHEGKSKSYLRFTKINVTIINHLIFNVDANN